jgi:DNA replication protein DnaC
MGDLERRLEGHRALDAKTIDILEREKIPVPGAGNSGNVCPKCHGFRYGVDPWCGRCAREFAEEYAAVYRAWIFERREHFLAGAGVPLAYLRCSLQNYETRMPEQTRALAAVKAWADIDSRIGLFLFGPPGTGKTHLAVAALLDLIARRRTGRYVSVSELLLEARESFRDRNGRPLSSILDCCTEIDSVLLDDLCAEKSTEFARETFLSIVDRAYGRQRPVLIVTSNLEIGALGRKLDERIADRIRELCIAVKVGGGSHRRRVGA